MRCTAYVPSFNGGRYLGATLRSLAAQTRAPDEILVIDDGSTDDTAIVARQSAARLISHDRNLGLAAARNTARRAALGEVIIGLDVDAVPAPDYVERVMARFESDSILAGLCGRLIEAHSVTLPDRWRQVHMPQHFGEATHENPRFCFGSVSSFRVAAIDTVGGWSPRFRSNYEDVDLSRRLRAGGLRTMYDSACIARHQRRDTPESVLSGFWNWFAPAGRESGQFQSLQALMDERLEQVTWGIFRHRLEQDIEQHRSHLIGLTMLLPAWMTLHDLREVGGSRGGAADLVHRYCELLQACGASEFVAADCEQRLVALTKRLFIDDVRSTSTSDLLIDRFTELANNHLPDEPLAWAQVEFSLRRLELESNSGDSKNDAFRVAIVNPPWHTKDRQGVRAGSRWPFTLDRRGDSSIPRYVPFPFFLAQSAQLLSDRGCPNAIVDAIAEGLSYSEFHERIVGYQPRAIVTEAAAASFDNDVAIWRRLRADLPDATLILCGPHATARRKELLEGVPEIDAILIGEYERTLATVIPMLENGEALTAIKGVATRVDGRIVDTGRPEPVPFDEVGRADRLRLPLYNYRDPFGGLAQPMAQLMATRGCPYECSFCQWPQVFYERRKIQRRSVESVFHEARELIERFGFRTVYFDDDMFSPGREWIERFAELIHAHALDLEWGIMARADTFKPDEIRLTATAGLRAAKFGVESGDQQMVDAMGKRLDLNRLRETCRVCREAGVRVHLTFTVGLPGESRETLANTRRLILELLPDTLQISRAMPLPGTSFEDWAVDSGAMKTRDVSSRDGFLISIIQHEDLPGEAVDAFVRDTYAEYRRARAGLAPTDGVPA